MGARRLYRVAEAGRIAYLFEQDGEIRRVVGDPLDRWEPGAVRPEGFDGLTLLAPVMPSKIVAVALNYKAHAAEQGKPLPAEPLIFVKPSTCVVGPGEAIRIPPGVGRVDHEAEVAVVIGRTASHVPARDAAGYLLGVTALNDVTARELQRRIGHYTRPKGYDTFAPVGPAIGLGLDPDDVAVRGWVNDELRQDSSTRDLIFPVPELVAFISSIMTLLPGDIITTGTPAGIGPLRPGDTVRVEVAGVGSLANPVVQG